MLKLCRSAGGGDSLGISESGKTPQEAELTRRLTTRHRNAQLPALRPHLNYFDLGNYMEVELTETPWGLAGQIRPRSKRCERGGLSPAPRKAELIPL